MGRSNLIIQHLTQCASAPLHFANGWCGTLAERSELWKGRIKELWDTGRSPGVFQGKTRADQSRWGHCCRAILEPGWRWATSVQPIAKTKSCEAPHFQYHVSGVLRVRMDDGTEFDCKPGDVSLLSSGHDAWVCRRHAGSRHRLPRDGWLREGSVSWPNSGREKGSIKI